MYIKLIFFLAKIKTFHEIYCSWIAQSTTFFKSLKQCWTVYLFTHACCRTLYNQPLFVFSVLFTAIPVCVSFSTQIVNGGYLKGEITPKWIVITLFLTFFRALRKSKRECYCILVAQPNFTLVSEQADSVCLYVNTLDL